MSLSSDEQAALLWPIRAKGAVIRNSPFGDPEIEMYYHQALEQGRHLERNIADAQHWLIQKKKDLTEKIIMYTHMNSLAVDGQLTHTPRAIKYVADSIKIIQDVTKFQKEIIGLIAAVTKNITILESMLVSMIAMVQANLNALALLLNSICNWGLPKLPSLPNLFPDTIWNWNGFNFFPLVNFAQLIKNLKFDANFAFSQCIINAPNLATVTNNPSTVTTASGLTYGTALILPPLSGIIADPTNPVYTSITTPPYYLPVTAIPVGVGTTFNANDSMLGAVPDPSTIVSDYQMPATTYQNNIVSIVPSLRDQTVEPSDSDYASPNLAVRNPNLRKALVHYVTLEQVVASNYDPNLTAAWLFYMETCRIGRAGTWLVQYQVAYTQYLSPSLLYLAENAVPWNCVYPSTVVNDAPTAIPLIATLTGSDPVTQGNILWQLSYLEASLLGYTRAQDWEAFASANFVNTFTGTDLDYRATSIDTTLTTTVILGATTAEYPTSCTFPSAIGNVLQEVIAIAAINIQNTPTYTTTRPQFKFVYDQFAQATVVDRFTQFWREFNSNLQALLLQDPYLISFVVSYTGSLDSAIDPLGNIANYNLVASDASTRNRSWVPGTPLLNIPVAPIVSISGASGPTDGQSGWSGTSFDPSTFLSRPDIQQLPIPTQIAMLRTNLSYAATQQMGQAITDSINNSIQQTQALLQDFQNMGFMVEVDTAINSVPVGALGLQVSFDQVDYDFTGNVTSPSVFTIQTAGNYALVVSLNWGAGDAGIRTCTVFVNGNTVIGTTSTDISQTAPTTIQLSVTPYFNLNDVVTVVATHGLNTAQSVIVGSYVSATLTDTVPPVNTVGVPTDSTSSTLSFMADAAISPLTALIVGSDGGVAAVDPTTVQTDGNGNPIYPIISGVSLTSAAQGDSVTVGSNYGGVYEYNGANFMVGGLLYAVGGGLLTQDYSVVVSTCQWVIVVGRAIATNQFIYEPHIPNLMNLGSF